MCTAHAAASDTEAVSLSFGPEGLFLDEHNPISLTVRNNGSEASSPITVQVYASTNTTISPFDTPLGTFELDALGPGETIEESLSVLIPTSIIAKNRYIGVIVSSGNDPDPTNNSAVTDEIFYTGRADMVASSIFTLRDTHTVGLDLEVQFSVRNTGTHGSGPVGAEIRISDDPVIDDNNTLLREVALGSFAPGSSVTLTELIPIPTDFPLGDHYLWLRVDPGEREIDLEDNTRIDTGAVTMLLCPVDLNEDGRLDFFDISILLNEMVDWNDDTAFNFFDLSGFLQDFQAGCP